MTISTEEPCEPTPYDQIFLYGINFDSSGNLTVANQKGEQIPGREVSLPIPCTKLVKIRNLQILEVEGCHYILVCNGGTITKYELAH